MQTRVRALFDKLLRYKLDRPEEFLDDLLQMTSRADIVKECVAAEYSGQNIHDRIFCCKAFP